MNKIVLYTLLTLSPSLLFTMEGGSSVKNKIKKIEQTIQETTNTINTHLKTTIKTTTDGLGDLDAKCEDLKKRNTVFTSHPDGAGKPPSIPGSLWLAAGLGLAATMYGLIYYFSRQPKASDDPKDN
jgi:hypothetical protein